jgi:hypothetical protein
MGFVFLPSPVSNCTITLMFRTIPMRAIPCLLAGCCLITIFRTHLAQWEWSDGDFIAVDPRPSIPVLPLYEADLNYDGTTERIAFHGTGVSILRGQESLWTSPPEWQIRMAQITDLNRDGRPELTLLVWRPFAPWPVDAVLPHGGRIAGFHDAQNQSCHIILIGWAGGRFRELWAGSALAEPLLYFYAADWNGDGRQELMAVETEYDHPLKGRALSLWEWNGFGFSLMGRRLTRVGKIAFLIDREEGLSILIDQTD